MSTPVQDKEEAAIELRAYASYMRRTAEEFEHKADLLQRFSRPRRVEIRKATPTGEVRAA